jgi:CcmD family protein
MTHLARRIPFAAAVFGAVFALAPGLAFAQEFQKVEGAPRAEMAASPFVASAYGFIWLAVLVYVFVVARGLARVDRELRDLEQKVQRSGVGSAAGQETLGGR